MCDKRIVKPREWKHLVAAVRSAAKKEDDAYGALLAFRCRSPVLACQDPFCASLHACATANWRTTVESHTRAREALAQAMLNADRRVVGGCEVEYLDHFPHDAGWTLCLWMQGAIVAKAVCRQTRTEAGNLESVGYLSALRTEDEIAAYLKDRRESRARRSAETKALRDRLETDMLAGRLGYWQWQEDDEGGRPQQVIYPRVEGDAVVLDAGRVSRCLGQWVIDAIKNADSVSPLDDEAATEVTVPVRPRDRQGPVSAFRRTELRGRPESPPVRQNETL